MSEEKENEPKTSLAEEDGALPEGLDIFDDVPEAVARREFTSPTRRFSPGAEGAEPEPPAEESLEEKQPEEEEIPEAEGAAAEEEIPEEERPPAAMPAWFDRAVSKIREEVKAEYEPKVKELRDLKSDLGRQKQEEVEVLRQEAQQQRQQTAERYNQASLEVGSQFVALMRAMKDAVPDENGQMVFTDDQGLTRVLNPQTVGNFLLSASGMGHGLFSDWQQSLNRIATRVEEKIFQRRPELSRYKDKFNQKVADLGLDLNSIHEDPQRVEIIYGILLNEDKVANFSDAKKEAKEAAIGEMQRKKKAMSPKSSGGHAAKTGPPEDEKTAKEAEESLGGLSATRRESRAHIF